MQTVQARPAFPLARTFLPSLSTMAAEAVLVTAFGPGGARGVEASMLHESSGRRALHPLSKRAFQSRGRMSNDYRNHQ
jgi:hypothetical protein